MADIRGAFRLEFKEQIEFLRSKINLPTAAWDDIEKSGHDRSFVVAGAMKADLLDDLHKAVENSPNLETFRARFREIVARHGWHGWTGEGSAKGEAWRTRIIFETNLRTSYAAGRYAQQTDPELLARCPYWQYIHNDSVRHPRPEHLAWGDAKLTLRYDHPFWQTHYPPNGWGCACRTTSVRKPAGGAQTTPPAGWDQIDPKTGEPPGIDKGWGYAPGATRADELRDLVNAKAEKYPEPLREDFLKEISAAPDAAPASVPVTLDDFITAGKAITEKIDPSGAYTSFMRLYQATVQTGAGCLTSSIGRGAQLVREASKLFPASWVEATNAFGPLYVKLDGSPYARGWHYLMDAQFKPGDLVRLDSFGVVRAQRNAGYIVTANRISNAVHEYTHRLQQALPEIQEKFAELHRRRTQGDQTEKMRTLYPLESWENDEITKKDQYIHAYWGKEYSDEPIELLTMAMETVIAGNNFDVLYTRDRAMLDFIVGILFYWKP